MILTRYYDPDHGALLGVQVDDAVYRLPGFALLSSWLRVSIGHVELAISAVERIPQEMSPQFNESLFAGSLDFERPHRLAPVDEQDVWGAGVTYERSLDARKEESPGGGDFYTQVYTAPRPEVFFKAHGRDVIGHLGEVGIRHDSKWSVPEPELGIVLNPALEVVGFTIGNDMSSRDIEGENPLYLPQAKIYKASCALGPGILLSASRDWLDTTIRLRVMRDRLVAFEGETHTNRIRRTTTELISCLGACNSFPNGVVLLTGTGVIPPADFTLQPGDIVYITIDGIGTLTNTVKLV
ncbi:2-dehydro-3-deoxy-D-arabinonate dehydratase [Planctomycetaceae bacterium]|nr:2-dehydro-3-deoxy-D-arabinonate dehydratase [Planctomycetaceae bacterium]